MTTNKYNRGMPIIKRHKSLEPISAEISELEVEKVETPVTPINFRRRQPVVANPTRVRATRLMTHTFFWALAS
jgi:hypothetical protein